MEDILSKENEAIADFVDLMHDIEAFKQSCIDKDQPALAQKWQGVLDAFSAFTPEEVINIEQFMN